MIEGLKAYSELKTSGALWLPEIPGSWEMRRIGRLFVERNETNAGELPILEVSLRTGVRVRNFETGSRKQVMENREKYKRARRGDLAYNMMRMWQGAVGVVPTDGLVSPAYVVARPLPGVEPRYFEYLFRTDAYKRQVNDYSRGIVADRNRLYWDSFKQIPTPFPPSEEQAAIVLFLDHADRQINRYIRVKRNLIVLLNEQKQAIIHRAVTRGLDPNVKLKPSGVEWLGDVPEHWEVRKLKHLVRFYNGLPFKPSDWSENGVPIIRIQNLNGSTAFNFTQKDGLSPFLMIKNGDMLFSWSGNRGTSFGPFVWRQQFSGYLNQHIFKMDNIHAHREYFYYLLRAVTKHVEEQTHGIIGLVHITKPKLGSIEVPLAPPAEQFAIARWIDELVSGVQAVADRALGEISLLREYRNRLIADVVTGKFDVREAAAELPDLSDDHAIDPADEDEFDDEVTTDDDTLAEAAE